MTMITVFCDWCGGEIRCERVFDEYGNPYIDEIPEVCPHCSENPVIDAYIDPPEDFCRGT